MSYLKNINYSPCQHCPQRESPDEYFQQLFGGSCAYPGHGVPQPHIQTGSGGTGKANDNRNILILMFHCTIIPGDQEHERHD